MAIIVSGALGPLELRRLFGFWLIHWEWVIGTTLAVAALAMS